MLRALMGLWLLERPEKKEAQDQRWPGELAKNPLMLKLVFSLEIRNSNFRSGENLPLFDMDESFYCEFWSGYLFINSPNVGGS